jgi:hypothetical protein
MQNLICGALLKIIQLATKVRQVATTKMRQMLKAVRTLSLIGVNWCILVAIWRTFVAKWRPLSLITVLHLSLIGAYWRIFVAICSTFVAN